MSHVNFGRGVDGEIDECYQMHYLPASLSYMFDNQFGVSFDKDFALLHYDNQNDAGLIRCPIDLHWDQYSSFDRN